MRRRVLGLAFLLGVCALAGSCGGAGDRTPATVRGRVLFRGRPLYGGGGHWRHRMTERLERMSPEERERLLEGMRRGCGRTPGPGTAPQA